MTPRRFAAVVSVVLLLLSRTTAAQSLPLLAAPVNDLAGVIDPASAAELDTRIRALLAASGDTVVVATVPSYAPYPSIEEYAVRLFAQSGIGDRERDRGALVLLALDERRVRIEVGYGLEEFITDGFAGEVIRQDMLPAFRAGEYGPGLLAGVTSVIRRLGESRGVRIDGLPAAPRPTVRGGPSAVQIVLIIVVLLALASSGSTRGRRRGRHWHGGLGGFGGGFGGFGGGFGGGRRGGFGGFGGGRSGGGGASGGF